MKQIIEGVLDLEPERGTFVHDVKCWTHHYTNSIRVDNTCFARLDDFHCIRVDNTCFARLDDFHCIDISIHELSLINERLSELGLTVQSIMFQDRSVIFGDVDDKKCLILVLTEKSTLPETTGAMS
jgi:hypothetical protein